MHPTILGTSYRGLSIVTKPSTQGDVRVMISKIMKAKLWNLTINLMKPTNKKVAYTPRLASNLQIFETRRGIACTNLTIPKNATGVLCNSSHYSNIYLSF
jgi:hypothetical protein